MNIADYLVIAIVVVSAIVGVFRGFLREVMSVLTWVVALLVAWYFSSPLEPYLGGLLADPQVRPWAARVIVFVLVLLLGAGVGALLGHVVRLSIFSGTDRFFGFLFGLARGVVVLGILVILCQALQLDEERWWSRSLLVPYAEAVGNFLRSLVGEELAAYRAHLNQSPPGP